jgi:lambda repressor-like predicted transcriptional regulator
MKHGTRNCYVHHHCRCEPCKAAKTAYQREWRTRKGKPIAPLLYWPLEPLFEAAGTDQIGELAVRTRVHVRTLHRAAHRGLTDPMADRAATRLGLHPSMIWPDWIDPYLEGAA